MASSRDSFGAQRASGRQFATTRWSIVLAAGHPSSPGANRALESLCQTYWYPLYAYVRRRVVDTSQAQDLTQAFFFTLLEKNYVRPATPERGRFRAFLLTAFKHFLSNEWEKARAQKRGGDRPTISFDFVAADSHCRLEPCTHLTPDELYERQWAMAILQEVMDRLAVDSAQNGKANQFDLLKDFIVGEPGDRTYAEVAAKLGTTPAAAKMAASRMRSRYRQLLRDEIAQTVASVDDIDDEIRGLFAALAR